MALVWWDEEPKEVGIVQGLGGGGGGGGKPDLS